jgi:outer membrane protein insertion porin family
MRLSPVLLAVVTITAPLSGSLSATAQTNQNSNQTPVATDSSQEHEVVAVYPAKVHSAAVDSATIAPEATDEENATKNSIKNVTKATTRITVFDNSQPAPSFSSTPQAKGEVVLPANVLPSNTVTSLPNALQKSPNITIPETRAKQTFSFELTPQQKLTPSRTKAIAKENSVAAVLKKHRGMSNAPSTVTSSLKRSNSPSGIPKQAFNQNSTPQGTEETASIKMPDSWKKPLVAQAPGLQNNAPQPTTPPSQEAPLPAQEQQELNQPTNNQPTNNQPTNNQPTNNQPTDNQPTDNQPTDNQPTNNQPTDNQPANTPTFPSAPGTTPAAEETRVLVSEVLVQAESGELTKELQDIVYRAVRTQAGRTTTRSQLQQDINAIFATGFFSNVQAVPKDTPLGVQVSFLVRPNPVLSKVQIEANPGITPPVASVISPAEVDKIFSSQYGKILNLRDLQESMQQLTKRYQEQGFVLANIVGSPQVSENGVVTLQVVEGVVENIRVRFRNKEGEETDKEGRPIRGRTREYIITREIELKPGKVFNRNMVQRDLQRVAGLGLFEDLNISLEPGTENPSKVNVIVNVAERNSGSIAAGAGISSASGLFGTVSYQEQNLGGNNQKLGAELQVGVRELLFDLRFTDPWIGGDPFRTSYTVNAFRRRSISLIFEGKDRDIVTFNPNNPGADGDRPRIVRTGGGINFTRPLSANPFQAAEWVASAGLQYQRISTTDSDGNDRRQGRLQNTNQLLDLTQSGSGSDDLVLLQLGLARDRRDSALQPTNGSFFRLGLDQSVPIGSGSIFLTRLRGSYSQYIPVKFTNFNKGAQTLAFNVQAGTVLGDLPIYEAFSLGGSNSIRGYDEGQLASSRSFLQASLEYRFPLISIVNAALFFDVGTDLGTGNAASTLLNKNGTGYGYGVGVRVNSPLGPIRVDYGINDEGDSRINFGIGERF